MLIQWSTGIQWRKLKIVFPSFRWPIHREPIEVSTPTYCLAESSLSSTLRNCFHATSWRIHSNSKIQTAGIRTSALRACSGRKAHAKAPSYRAPYWGFDLETCSSWEIHWPGFPAASRRTLIHVTEHVTEHAPDCSCLHQSNATLLQLWSAIHRGHLHWKVFNEYIHNYFYIYRRVANYDLEVS